MSEILLPPSTLLMGPAGTGKTSAIATLLLSGLKVRMLATEPTSPNRVIERLRILKREDLIDNFDWTLVSPSPPKWDSLKDSANLVNTMTLEQLAKINTGIARQDGAQWIRFLEQNASFVSAKTGEILGDVTEWGPDCAYVIDGLTGLSTMSRNLTIGLKPTPNPGEWGVMQNNILVVVNKLASDSKCFFILIGHIERENDEITGLKNVTVSTLGAKLAPKLPPLFTNVVLTKRIAMDFFWSTSDSGVDTKSGDLPMNDKLAPDFKPIVEAFRARLKAAEAPTQPLAIPASASTQG